MLKYQPEQKEQKGGEKDGDRQGEKADKSGVDFGKTGTTRIEN